MKKKFLLVGAFVAVAMSAMFVACSTKNDPVQGCTCTIIEGGERDTEYFTLQEMAGYGATTCSGFASALQGAYASHGMYATVSCH